MIISSPIKPESVTSQSGGGAQIRLRLSDGNSWAHECTASSPIQLADGCMEAFVACYLEWQRKVNEIPPYQTRKRAAMLITQPVVLELHVFDNSPGAIGGQWINANYGTDGDRVIIARRPGTSSGKPWDSEPWEEYWLRCLRCWNTCANLHAFCGTVVKKLDLK